MEKFNLRITQNVHVLVHHVPEYVRLTRVQLGPTFEQAPASQHRIFDIFYHRFKVDCTTTPISREHLINAV